MNPNTILKVVGVVLSGVLFVHLLAMPWGLVATAGLACIVLP